MEDETRTATTHGNSITMEYTGAGYFIYTNKPKIPNSGVMNLPPYPPLRFPCKSNRIVYRA